ncbi:MAG: carbohydrate-binding family 9-like protein [Acidobacteria bacterium]|nr:carbohydrate-binding family 9-like protein [Acidobacteriota bacterium]
MKIIVLLAPLLLAPSANSAPPDPAPEYTIYRAPSAITIDAKLDEAAWKRAPLAGPFHFNWWKAGEKEQTDARMLWDDDNLYVAWYCHDKHIAASVTQRHGPVSNDDCAEIFLSPNPEKVKNYYTFEINAIGAMLNRCRTDWWTGPPNWEPDGVRYRTTYHGQVVKQESPSDHDWVVELAIPFRNFSHDAAHTPPREGDRWRLNLYRTGGITNAQNSSWSPLPADRESFHNPPYFGPVRFSTRKPPKR